MTTGSMVWTSLVPADTVVERGRIAVGARGHRIRYADGSERLCATSGLWNAPLGYGNDAVAEAVARSLRDASYLSLFRTRHAYADAAAGALLDVAGAPYRRVIFSTSGGAANDAVMKLVRQDAAQRGDGTRTIVVGLRGSYHGTMYGSHALSGDDLLQGLYGLDRRAVRHVRHDDGGEELAALLRRDGARVAAVVVEPVLGSGARVVDDAFVERLIGWRDEFGFVLVADEVATGFGRTGEMFASGRWPEPPDLLVLSKALTNGTMGAAAILVGERIATAFVRGGWTFVHGETQAGTPPVAAAILAVLDELDRIDVEATTRALGADIAALARALVADGLVADVTGAGCFIALGLRGPDGEELDPAGVRDVVAAVHDGGAVVQPGPGCVQLIPAYGFDAAEIAELDAALRSGLRAVRVRAAEPLGGGR